jgi:hypothetical protein
MYKDNIYKDEVKKDDIYKDDIYKTLSTRRHLQDDIYKNDIYKDDIYKDANYKDKNKTMTSIKISTKTTYTRLSPARKSLLGEAKCLVGGPAFVDEELPGEELSLDEVLHPELLNTDPDQP